MLLFIFTILAYSGLYIRLKGLNIYYVPAICLALISHFKNGIKLNPEDQNSTASNGIMKKSDDSLKKKKKSIKWIEIPQNN